MEEDVASAIRAPCLAELMTICSVDFAYLGPGCFPVDSLRVPVLLQDMSREPPIFLSSWHIMLPSDVPFGGVLGKHIGKLQTAHLESKGSIHFRGYRISTVTAMSSSKRNCLGPMKHLVTFGLCGCRVLTIVVHCAFVERCQGNSGVLGVNEEH